MKVFVMTPTYDEGENIEKLINSIQALGISNLHVVVVDDYSPDKTWEIVDKISKKQKNVHLLLRKNKRGRGYAGKAGFKYCLDNGADVIVEMDADFSHNPKYIPELLKQIKNNDVVLGSRFVKGGKQIGREPVRRIITRLATLYTKIILNLRVKDPNSGFRCFRKNALSSVVGKITAKGPHIVQETLYLINRKGFRIKEVPIVFENRTRGKSKLGLKHLIKALYEILRLRCKRY